MIGVFVNRKTDSSFAFLSLTSITWQYNQYLATEGYEHTRSDNQLLGIDKIAQNQLDSAESNSYPSCCNVCHYVYNQCSQTLLTNFVSVFP